MSRHGYHLLCADLILTHSRRALGIDKALEEITNDKRVLHDPEVVDAYLKVFSEGKFECRSYESISRACRDKAKPPVSDIC